VNISKLRFFFTFAIYANSLLLGCSSARDSSGSSLKSWEPQPLEKKSGRHSFCGIEALTKIEHPSCRVKDYIEKRSNACGTERSIEKPSLSCPGSIPFDVQVMRSWGGCGNPASKPNCPGGYYPVKEWKKTESCLRRVGRDIENYRDEAKEWSVTCQRDEVLNTCSKEEFGPAEYKLCRDPSHGPESYDPCEVPGISPQLYKECSYYLTPEESKIYVRQQQSLIDSQADALLYFKSDILSLQNNKIGFSCLISKLTDDESYQSITERLKKIYAGTFGEKFQPIEDSVCQNPATLAEPICQTGDNSNLCRAVISYRAVHQWFEILRQDAQNLLTESYLKEDLSLKESLGKLLSKSNTMLSPAGQ
jgi:hypothetical protein